LGSYDADLISKKKVEGNFKILDEEEEEKNLPIKAQKFSKEDKMEELAPFARQEEESEMLELLKKIAQKLTQEEKKKSIPELLNSKPN